MVRLRDISAAAALAAVTLLASCGGPTGGEPPSAAVTDPRERNNPSGRIGDIFSSGPLGGGRGGGGELAVNRHLWLAALDTLSFMPLASTDPFSGVIATDWSNSADAPDERLKVTVYVSDPSLAASSLRVAVFREVRGPGGAWLSADVADATPRRLEDAILTRARQLRVSELEASRRRS